MPHAGVVHRMAADFIHPSSSTRCLKTSVFLTIPWKRPAWGPMAVTMVGSEVWLVPVQPTPVWLLWKSMVT